VFSITANVIVHSHAFSHRKVARDIEKVIGGVVLAYHERYDTFNQNVLVVSTIDYLDIAMSAPFIIPAKKCIYYGVVEGIPIITPQARSVINNCVTITPSRFAKRCVEKAGITVHDIIPHAVDLPDPDYNSVITLRGRLFVDHNCRWVVGWIGANQIRKGLDIAFEVGEKLPRDVCLLLITGEGEIEISDDLPRNVIFFDKVFRVDNISNYIMVFDLFLNTSRSEGFGLPVYEALSLGKKVVVPDLPVFREYLSGTDGVFFYEVGKPRYELYLSYMWMEYREPKSIDDVVETIISALRSDKKPKAEIIRERFNLDLYKRFKKYLRDERSGYKDLLSVFS